MMYAYTCVNIVYLFACVNTVWILFTCVNLVFAVYLCWYGLLVLTLFVLFTCLITVCCLPVLMPSVLFPLQGVLYTSVYKESVGYLS